jgi:hypothetical protein
MNRSILILAALVAFTVASTAEEGMWLLDSTPKLPLSKYKKAGMELSAEEIYSTSKASLKDAVVRVMIGGGGGGTGSFISRQGLVLTNHHVAFGAIQAASSMSADYLKDGFLAKTRAEEIPTNYSFEILVSMREVTGEVLATARDAATESERAEAVRLKSAELEKAAKGTTDYICRVSEMYGGIRYYLMVFERITDVRLVYAPPTDIGNFGGEVDNWMWPRHTGDFAILRAYVGPNGKPAPHAAGNIPYTPRSSLPISAKGVAEGTPGLILGFPGRTFRLRDYHSVKLSREEELPATVSFYRTRMDAMETAMAKDREVAIKYASKYRRVANFYKKSKGIMEGLDRSRTLAEKQEELRQVTAAVAASPSLARKYPNLARDLELANDEVRAAARQSIYYTNLTTGSDALVIASRFDRYARTFREDPESGDMIADAKARDSLAAWLVTFFRDYDPGVDRMMLRDLMLASQTLPAGQRSALMDGIVDGQTGEEMQGRVQEKVDDLFDDTKLLTKEGAMRMLETEDSEDITSDPLVALSRRIREEQDPVSKRTADANASLAWYRRGYTEGLLAARKQEVVYPDANSTIRLTYGTVVTLEPRDAVRYAPVTTLTGIMEKETGRDPFDLPPRLRQLWEKKDFGRWADPKLKDVPVAFLTNHDITGGNSGSPVVNGRGELIGCAFDGNWEGVLGDYEFEDRYFRTISVDARYILFVLEKFSGAETLMKELVIR